MNKNWMILGLLLLTACESKPKECHDKKTLDTIKEIVWQNVVKQLGEQDVLLDQETFKGNLQIEHPRPTGYEETIKKYTCAGTIRYVATGLPEFGKSLDEGGSRYRALKDERKASVQSPLRYNALSLLSDKPYLLDELMKNSDAMGYTFQTEYTSQRVGDEDYASVGLAPANLVSLYVAAALSATPQAVAAETSKPLEPVETESGYELSGKEKGIIAQGVSNFQKTYDKSGVSGVLAERNQCYQAADSIKDSTLTLQCISYDYSSSAIIKAIEKSQNFPMTEGLSETDVKIRALQSVENTVSEKLNTTKLRETFVKGIQAEVRQQIAHEAKKL